MAVWQYDLHLVPLDQSGVDPRGYRFLPDGTLDIDPLSCHGVVPDSLPEFLGNALGPSCILFRGIRSWGAGAGNRVDVCSSAEGLVENVFVRIDARSPSRTFMSLLVSMANNLGCSFLDPLTRRVIRADSSALEEALVTSRATLFCRDPEGFIKDLASGA